MSKSPTPSPKNLSDRLRQVRLDATALPIVVAGLVLLGAVLWLLTRPLPDPAPAQERLAGEVGTLAQRLDATEARLAQVAGRPAPEPVGPVRDAATQAAQAAAAAAQQAREASEGAQAATQRAQAAEARAQAAETRASAVEERLSGAERSLRELLARPVLDPAALASRAALEALGARLDRLSDRADAAARQAEQDQIPSRLSAVESSLNQRTQQVSALAQRIEALEGQLAERTRQATALVSRVEELEGAQSRLAALEGRSARLAAVDALRTALEAGRPLGGVLATLRDPPPALNRFANTAPPTEAALRLSFEDAARAAREASEPAREGQGVLDSAMARLSGLVTVRRGDEVVWGDAAAAEIERARRALEAGDLEGALALLRRLPPRAQEAIKGWTDQAEALVAARAALRNLAAG